MSTRATGLTRKEVLAAGALLLGSCAARRSASSGRRNVALVYDDRGGLFVEALLDRRASARLIFDTGAATSTLSNEYVSRLQLPLREGSEIHGSAGAVQAKSATATVDIPGLGEERIDFAVYDFGSYDASCVGILGYEYLRRAPFQIRYRAKELLWNAAPPERTQPMLLDGGIPRINARVNGATVDLRIDTGASFAPCPEAYLNVTESQAEGLGVSVGSPVKFFNATGTGGAKLTLPVFPLDDLEVGGVRLPRAFAIVQPRVGYFARHDAVGFLGNSVLEKLDPYLDYSAGTFGVGVRSPRGEVEAG